MYIILPFEINRLLYQEGIFAALLYAFNDKLMRLSQYRLGTIGTIVYEELDFGI